MAENWSSGAAYDGYIGRWSRPVAERFVRWLDPRPDAAWLDVGCGSGALTATILRDARPSRVVGVDPSPDFVDHARSTIDDERTEFAVGDGGALPVAEESVDYVVSGLVLNFIADPDAALAEMSRVARAGSTIAAYVWDYAEGMQMLRVFWDVAVELDPAAADLDEATRFPLCRPNRSAACSRRRGWPTWSRATSRSRRSSPTSTTTGTRSSAARARRRATAPHCRPQTWTGCVKRFTIALHRTTDRSG